MTKQASETIEYNGEKYSLYSDPLAFYFSLNDSKRPYGVASCAWRGYIGNWVIKNAKLYLKDISFSEESVETIFNKNAPILADWYTGPLKIAIGEIVHYDWFGDNFYDYYLQLKIENGLVVGKNIVKYIDDDLPINFGKYSGYNLSDIIKGGVNSFFGDVLYFCKVYIRDLLDFFCKKEFNKIIKIPSKSITETKELISLANNLKGRDISFLVTETFVAIDDFSKDSSDQATQFSRLIENMLTADFNNLQDLIRDDARIQKIESDINLVNPDIDYLQWAINEIPEFSVPPHIFRNYKKLHHLDSFKINRLNTTVFEYKPITRPVKLDFKQETLKINIEKFQNLHQAIYDGDNNVYYPDVSDIEHFRRFDRFLD